MADTRIGAITVDVNVRFANLDKGLKDAARSLRAAEKQFSDIGGLLSKAITAPLAGIGVVAIKAAVDYDKAFATIRRKTGETGADLDKLKKNFNNLFSKGDDSAAEVAATLSKVRVTTGATGEELENLAGIILDLADVTEADFNTVLESSTGLLKSWKIANEDAGGSLDFVFKVAQQSGASLTGLSDQLTKLGPTLRTLGFSFQESAVLLGEFSKQGLDGERVITGFQKVIPKLVEAGIPLKAGFEAITSAISSAGGDTQKAEAILNSFGRKSIPELTQALNLGRDALRGMVVDIDKMPETISKAAKESEDFEKKLSTLGNAVTSALEPIGAVLLDTLVDAFDQVKPKLQQFGDYLRGLDPDTLKLAVSIGALAAILGPATIAIGAFIGSLREVIVVIRGLGLFLAKGSPLAIGISALSVAVVASGFIWLKWGDRVKSAFNTATTALVSFSQKAVAMFPGTAAVGNAINEGLSKSPLARLFSSGLAHVPLEARSPVAGFSDWLQNKYTELKTTVGSGLKTAFDAAGNAIKDAGSKLLGTGEQSKLTADNLKNLNGILAGKGDSTKQKADEAAEAVKGLQQQFEQLQGSLAVDQIRDQIQNSLDVGDFDRAESFIGKLYEATYNSTLSGMADAVKAGGAAAEEWAIKIAEATANDAASQARESKNKEQAASLKKAHVDAVKAWREAFSTQLSSISFELKDILGQTAVGFGAEVATSLGLKAQDNPFSADSRAAGGALIGQALASGISSIGNLFSQSPDFIGPQQPSASESLLGAQGVDAVSSLVSALPTVVQNFQKQSQEMSDLAAGIQAGTTLIGVAVGGYFGGPAGAAAGAAIGAVVGQGINAVFGDTPNAETKARTDLTGALEELTGTIQFFNSNGSLTSTNNLLSGNDTIQFKPPALDPSAPGFATTAIDQFGNTAVNAFSGVFNALEEVMGITEDVGTQVGISILTQFAGDIEGLKALVDVAKLTYEDFVNALIEAGKKGEGTWLQIVSEIRDGAPAFMDGIEGLGQFAKAFENLLNAGGKGQIALNQVKNLAIEAQEAGLSTLEQLGAKLVETGQFTQLEIDALFASFRDNGIKQLSDIAKLTDLDLAKIVAGLDAFLQDHGGKWRTAAEDIQAYSDGLDKLDGKEIAIRINVNTNIDNETQQAIDQGILDSKDVKLNTSDNVTAKFATGAILRGPTFVRPGALAGEAGPEGILPLTSVNGKLGVHAVTGGGIGGITLNIDARGADRGVEQDIIAALSDMEERIVQRSVSTMVDAAARGNFGGIF